MIVAEIVAFLTRCSASKQDQLAIFYSYIVWSNKETMGILNLKFRLALFIVSYYLSFETNYLDKIFGLKTGSIGNMLFKY